MTTVAGTWQLSNTVTVSITQKLINIILSFTNHNKIFKIFLYIIYFCVILIDIGMTFSTYLFWYFFDYYNIKS